MFQCNKKDFFKCLVLRRVLLRDAVKLEAGFKCEEHLIDLMIEILNGGVRLNKLRNQKYLVINAM